VAPRIEDHAEWRAHLLHRLRQQVELTADPKLIALQKELLSYPAPPEAHGASASDAIMVPFRVRTSAGLLSFYTTTMVFGTPVDVTLSELMVETFFAADAQTAQIVRALSR
jgi:hypothetical protein